MESVISAVIRPLHGQCLYRFPAGDGATGILTDPAGRADVESIRRPGCDQRELLHSPAGFHFAGIQIAPGVRDDRVNVMELAGVAPRVPRGALHRAVASQERPDDVVLSVGYQ